MEPIQWNSNMNLCIFSGEIEKAPILRNDDKPILEIVLNISKTRFPTNIDLRAYNQYALVLYPQLSIYDLVEVWCKFAPAKITGMDILAPRFIVNKLTILQKKNPFINLTFSEDKC